MTLHVGPLPDGDERHLKALDEAIAEHPGDCCTTRRRRDETTTLVAAYHRSLADQGVRLVDASNERLTILTVCTRSGQVPHECGLAACDNGCETEDLTFVRVASR